jgi:hypothetical protein
MREWLAARLGVHAKNITLVGSARLGESLSPRRLGQPFGGQSDLDLVVVSDTFFERLRGDFCSWEHDYETGGVTPKNTKERGYWDDNVRRGPQVISRGFLDARMVPSMSRYPCAEVTAQTMFLLTRKLSETPKAPSVSQASVRVYRDWDAFVRQIDRNLQASITVGVERQPASSVSTE